MVLIFSRKCLIKTIVLCIVNPPCISILNAGIRSGLLRLFPTSSYCLDIITICSMYFPIFYYPFLLLLDFLHITISLKILLPVKPAGEIGTYCNNSCNFALWNISSRLGKFIVFSFVSWSFTRERTPISFIGAY